MASSGRRVFTERFLATQATGWTYWTVPAGKRAVIRSVDVCNFDTAQWAAIVQLAGMPFVNTFVGGGGGRLNYDGRQVLYAGEQLGVYLQHGNMSISVSGYLFNDP